jgi:carbon-monoxide dehydrogenase medium subunit
MYPAPCDYYRAASLDEAIELLATHPEGRLLAGGHSLIPMMKLRLAQPAALIDIGRIDELGGIEPTGDGVRIGALTTHAELAGSSLLAEACPLLAEAAARIADPQVRNKGTLGGNIAHADPGSDLPAVLVALDATVYLHGRGGGRTVPARRFFTGLLTTDMAAGEVLVAVEARAHGAGTGAAYLKVEHPASGYAVVGAAAVMQRQGGTVAAASLAFNGVTETPHLAAAVTDALTGGDGSDAAIDLAVDGGLAIAEPMGDLHASGEYRRHLAAAYGKRALKLARDRAV